MLQELDETVAHAVRAVILAQLGETELEEKGEALHQTHPTLGHTVQVLQDEVPDLVQQSAVQRS